MLKAGEYRNASEALRDAIRALQRRRPIDALKLERLRRSIDAGLADLDSGDYEEIDDADLEGCTLRIRPAARQISGGKLSLEVEPVNKAVVGPRFPARLMGNPTIDVHIP